MKKITRINKFIVQGKQMSVKLLGDEMLSYMLYYSDMTCYLYFMSTAGAEALAITSGLTID